jgi:hypothetical protein
MNISACVGFLFINYIMLYAGSDFNQEDFFIKNPLREIKILTAYDDVPIKTYPFYPIRQRSGLTTLTGQSL